MSHFYGSLRGLDSLAIPGGGVDSESGLEARLGSNEGSVSVRLSEGEAPDGGLEDRVRIVFQRVLKFCPTTSVQIANYVGHDFELYDGPISECVFESIRTNTQEVEK